MLRAAVLRKKENSISINIVIIHTRLISESNSSCPPQIILHRKNRTIAAVKPVLESVLKDYYAHTDEYKHEYIALDFLCSEELQGKSSDHPAVLVPSRILTFILLTTPVSFFSHVKIDELRISWQQAIFWITKQILQSLLNPEKNSWNVGSGSVLTCPVCTDMK